MTHTIFLMLFLWKYYKKADTTSFPDIVKKTIGFYKQNSVKTKLLNKSSKNFTI